MSRHLPAILLAAAALGGCGGDDDDKPGRTLSVQAGKPLTVVGDEYAFDPETVIVEGAVSPTKLRITLKNDGALAHNLKLLRDGTEVGGTPTFQGGGEQRSAAVTLEPGSYEMVCTVGNHAELGMVGKLEVR